MSRFFIHRPIFAWVIAILIMLVGILAINNLPIEQYPKIAPPQVKVRAVYPGADAETVENSVTQIIEQQMKGIDGLMYMSSNSSAAGSASVTLTFENGTDPDTAQVQVQNKLQSAMSSLPETVQRTGLNVEKSASDFLMVTAFVSEDGSMDQSDIADYVATSIVDPISRVEGVGGTNVFGSSYAMRIWLDPAKLRAYNLIPSDVSSAIRSQNVQVSAGQLGTLPTNTDRVVINATVSVQSYLQTPEQFEDILLKTDTAGAQVRIKDVARVELGSENYQFRAQYNGQAASGLAIMLAPGANALEVREAVGVRLDELSQNFPTGLKMVVPYDTTPFVRLSITQVVYTLLEAVVLVFLVMFLFLQNWRATIIPTLAVPVVILGTFAVLSVFGYSINILTMFAMVLAIGLLVDDAIIVVENVERILEENPSIQVMDATIQSMREISKVVIGIALILSVVFVPMIFFGGSSGVIYRQFAVTLMTSMVLSAFIALVFTPALCVTILKRQAHKDINIQTGFFGWFNRFFYQTSRRYENFIGKTYASKLAYLAVYTGIVAVMALIFMRLPSSFVPEEDQGAVMTLVQLPAGSTLDKTNAVMDKLANYYHDKETDNIESVFTISGFGFMGSGQNSGMAFIKLKDWDERAGSENTAQSIARRAMVMNMMIPEASLIFPIAPPPIQGFGNTSGFDLQLKDVGGVGHEALLDARNQLMGMAMQNPAIASIRPGGQEDAPKLKVDINQAQAAAYGVPLTAINDTIAQAWGGSYVNDFIDRGRIKKVYIQGEPDSRVVPEDINRWYVRNQSGEMVSFGAFSGSQWEYGSPSLARYNGVSSMVLTGSAALGVSTGDAMEAMAQMASQLPAGIDFEWTGLSLEQQKSGGQAPILYALSILVVFLCLAALYESWSVPFAVILVIPLGVIGSLLLTKIHGLANDVYLQVALLTVIGLSAKNAILIIEFAKEIQESGQTLKASIMMAARMRLRPIIMTSLAFGVGVVPLYIATGAGSGSQNAVGTGVLGGVLTSTFLGIFFIPMFYVWVRTLFPYKPKAQPVTHAKSHEHV
ncbi:multidrug efflux RND transporter permease subunit [Moraxella catarrhalis]|uniref:Efflux pump membrane transporter n=1 Tax=Moraxella catarrhalis TaxID=480 RepID=A0A3A9PU39_MORCA|nr:efflux RND transporter permease subunit [Moraxella catarrhalis]AIK00364.1 multidrug resistance protein MexB [Moraxella catarrhalis]ARE66300.1 multidrug efflux RND transporter permease subunit [Moraxella catarrhalis]AVL50771.1 multidrug efflux RND transporter permease subunit [Moraxella catarrhalis]AZQ94186.1 RND transporter, hydrophobe/amphiphile efflux-1 family protein [Moraxella catarrhalis]AZQ95855.1 RND transporter, hydrophobe/amphiphile efflux-1 family protein [Moraxella catarrhalis]